MSAITARLSLFFTFNSLRPDASESAVRRLGLAP